MLLASSEETCTFLWKNHVRLVLAFKCCNQSQELHCKGWCIPDRDRTHLRKRPLDFEFDPLSTSALPEGQVGVNLLADRIQRHAGQMHAEYSHHLVSNIASL